MFSRPRPLFKKGSAGDEPAFDSSTLKAVSISGHLAWRGCGVDDWITATSMGPLGAAGDPQQPLPDHGGATPGAGGGRSEPPPGTNLFAAGIRTDHRPGDGRRPYHALLGRFAIRRERS